MTNKLPWKPDVGETFYFFDSSYGLMRRLWNGEMDDYMYFVSGNCFKNGLEAQMGKQKFQQKIDKIMEAYVK